MEKEIGYRKTYRMYSPVKGRRYVVVSIPYEVIERQAAMRSMTVPEFLEQFVAIAEYNSFEGVHYSFKEKDTSDS